MFDPIYLSKTLYPGISGFKLHVRGNFALGCDKRSCPFRAANMSSVFGVSLSQREGGGSVSPAQQPLSGAAETGLGEGGGPGQERDSSRAAGPRHTVPLAALSPPCPGVCQALGFLRKKDRQTPSLLKGCR